MSGEERDRWERVESCWAGGRVPQGRARVSKELTVRQEKQWIRGKGCCIEAKGKVSSQGFVGRNTKLEHARRTGRCNKVSQLWLWSKSKEIGRFFSLSLIQTLITDIYRIQRILKYNLQEVTLQNLSQPFVNVWSEKSRVMSFQTKKGRNPGNEYSQQNYRTIYFSLNISFAQFF